MNYTNDDLMRTITKLERRLDLQKATIAALSLLTALVVTVLLLSPHLVSADEKDAEQPPIQEVVKARCFLLIDKDGRTIAALTRHVDSDKPILNFYAADAGPRATLGLNREDHPILSLLDDEGRQRLRMYLNQEYAGQVDMFDVNKHANVEIQAGSYPHLYMRCDAKYGRVFLDTTKNGSMLKLLGEDGDNSVAVGVDSDGEPVLTMKDEQAKEVFRAPKKAD